MRHLRRSTLIGVVFSACAVGCSQPDATADDATANVDLKQQAAPEIPTDCRTMLSAAVLEQLGSTPLNHPSLLGDTPAGVQRDGSLLCLWRHPAADTTGLFKRITRVDEAEASKILVDLAEREGFLCYTPSGGTRCEKTWSNPTYPVIDGRTVFWRDGIFIDTQYSNLAPNGYTASIVASIFGE